MTLWDNSKYLFGQVTLNQPRYRETAMDKDVKVYGADSCQDTRRTREHLQDLGVLHRYISVDEDSLADDRVRAWNGGVLRTPTVLVQGSGGAEQLTTPSDDELDGALERQGLLPPSPARR
jgi:glutaredoxin